MAEHSAFNRRAAGSSPARGISLLSSVVERTTLDRVAAGSNPAGGLCLMVQDIKYRNPNSHHGGVVNATDLRSVSHMRAQVRILLVTPSLVSSVGRAFGF